MIIVGIDLCTIRPFFYDTFSSHVWGVSLRSRRHVLAMKNARVDLFAIISFVYGNALFSSIEVPSHIGVSSTVGAPCNEESLCNRAGWLGMGCVKVLARLELLPRSGSGNRLPQCGTSLVKLGSSLP